MKALFPLRISMDYSWLIALATLVSLAFVIYPEAGLAAEGLNNSEGQNTIVFEIKNPALGVTDQTNTTTQISLQLKDIVQNDPLVVNLKNYLLEKGSPLADSADYVVTKAHWQRDLAISFVESSMCRFTPKYFSRGTQESYNCSGIGGNDFKRYDSYTGWLDDMDNLMSQPNYVDRPIEKFLRYYVYPGSQNWLNGVKQVESELAELETVSNDQRVALANTNTVMTASVQSPQLVNLNQ